MGKFGIALLALILAVATAFAGAAGKFDGKAAAAEWYQAHKECRLPIEGQTSKQADEQCKHRDALTVALKAHHYCFDTSEQEWARCKP